MRYHTRYVHKIAPSDRDVGPDVTIDGAALANTPDGRKAMGAALRAAGVLGSGARVTRVCLESDRIIIFPMMPGLTTYWHSVILTIAVEV